MDCIFLLFCMPIYFLLGTRCCKFYLVGCWYFYISTDMLELCSWMHLSYLKQINPFRLFCLDLLGSAQSRTNYFPLCRQDPSEYSAQCPVNHEVFQFDWWNRHYFWSCLSDRHCSFESLQLGFFLWSSVISSQAGHMVDQSFAEYVRETLCRPYALLSVWLSQILCLSCEL